MCLAVPGRIEELIVDDGVPMARVAFSGVLRRVCLAHVPEAVVGDYVLVHVGFAITIIDAEEAAKVFEHLERIGEIEAELAEARPA